VELTTGKRLRGSNLNLRVLASTILMVHLWECYYDGYLLMQTQRHTDAIFMTQKFAVGACHHGDILFYQTSIIYLQGKKADGLSQQLICHRICVKKRPLKFSEIYNVPTPRHRMNRKNSVQQYLN
jgi:hypothetical protein